MAHSNSLVRAYGLKRRGKTQKPVDHRRAKHYTSLCFGLFLLLGAGSASIAAAQSETVDQLIAKVLSNRLSSVRGRARLARTDRASGKSETKRLVVKARRDGHVTKILYQLAAPAAEAGQAVVIEKEDGKPTRGFLIESPENIIPLASRMMQRPFFGTDFRLEDLTDDFLDWPVQEIVGTEVIRGCQCRIVESRPQAGLENSRSVVRSWICPRMSLPFRIEREGRDAKSTRILVVERVAKIDRDRWTARSLAVTAADGSTRTVLEGTSSGVGAIVPAAEFEIKALRAAFKAPAEPLK